MPTHIRLSDIRENIKQEKASNKVKEIALKILNSFDELNRKEE